MKQLPKRYIVVALIGCLSACSQAASVGSPPSAPMTAADVRASNSSEPTLYVSNRSNADPAKEWVSVYADGGSSYLRSLTTFGEGGFAVDAKGDAFIPEYGTGAAGPINIYANQGANLVQTFSQKTDYVLYPQVDSDGNFFDLCTSALVCEWPAGKGGQPLGPHVSRRIRLSKLSGGTVRRLALDSKGDLAVPGGEYPATVVFAPGKLQPYWSIRDIDLSRALVFDSAGNLFLEVGGSAVSTTIGEFAPRKTSPERTIATTATVQSMAADQAGNLYVLLTDNSVAVYPPASSAPSLVITSGLDDAYAMAVSPAGEVFVANSTSPGSIEVYAPGQNMPIRTVTEQISEPYFIGLGP